jgi:hypothetical protein
MGSVRGERIVETERTAFGTKLTKPIALIKVCCGGTNGHQSFAS